MNVRLQWKIHKMHQFITMKALGVQIAGMMFQTRSGAWSWCKGGELWKNTENMES